MYRSEQHCTLVLTYIVQYIRILSEGTDLHCTAVDNTVRGLICTEQTTLYGGCDLHCTVLVNLLRGTELRVQFNDELKDKNANKKIYELIIDYSNNG